MRRARLNWSKERKNGQIGQTISAPPPPSAGGTGPPGRGEAGAAPAAAHPHQARPVQPGQDAPHLLLGAGEPASRAAAMASRPRSRPSWSAS